MSSIERREFTPTIQILNVGLDDQTARQIKIAGIVCAIFICLGALTLLAGGGATIALAFTVSGPIAWSVTLAVTGTMTFVFFAIGSVSGIVALLKKKCAEVRKENEAIRFAQNNEAIHQLKMEIKELDKDIKTEEQLLEETQKKFLEQYRNQQRFIKIHFPELESALYEIEHPLDYFKIGMGKLTPTAENFENTLIKIENLNKNSPTLLKIEPLWQNVKRKLINPALEVDNLEKRIKDKFKQKQNLTMQLETLNPPNDKKPERIVSINREEATLEEYFCNSLALQDDFYKNTITPLVGWVGPAIRAKPDQLLQYLHAFGTEQQEALANLDLDEVRDGLMEWIFKGIHYFFYLLEEMQKNKFLLSETLKRLCENSYALDLKKLDLNQILNAKEEASLQEMVGEVKVDTLPKEVQFVLHEILKMFRWFLKKMNEKDSPLRRLLSRINLANLDKIKTLINVADTASKPGTVLGFFTNAIIDVNKQIVNNIDGILKTIIELTKKYEATYQLLNYLRVSSLETLYKNHNIKQYLVLVNKGIDFFKHIILYAKSFEKRNKDPECETAHQQTITKSIQELSSEAFCALQPISKEILASTDYKGLIQKADLFLQKADMLKSQKTKDMISWIENTVEKVKAG